jgi:hypothetical protein
MQASAGYVMCSAAMQRNSGGTGLNTKGGVVLVVETTNRLTREVQEILAKDKNARVITAGDFNEVSCVAGRLARAVVLTMLVYLCGTVEAVRRYFGPPGRRRGRQD